MIDVMSLLGSSDSKYALTPLSEIPAQSKLNDAWIASGCNPAKGWRYEGRIRRSEVDLIEKIEKLRSELDALAFLR